MKKTLVAIVVLLLSGCSTMGQTLVVSGESLKALGNEFVQVSTMYKNGCDVTKTIKQSDCQNFKKFGENFQKTYPMSISLWEAARSANDKAATDKVEVVLNDLATNLSSFAVVVLQTYGGK
jgi:uncharacterized lipoprotein YajG